MSKLTEKVKNTDDFIRLPTKDKQEFINKLGRLEDLEEPLGFPLEKLSEVNNIYVNDWEGVLRKYEIMGVNFKEKKIWFWGSFCPMYIKFEYYKKGFWLKDDKSE